jgi:hypothetical protein
MTTDSAASVLSDVLAVMDEDSNLQKNTDNAAVAPAPTFERN